MTITLFAQAANSVTGSACEPLILASRWFTFADRSTSRVPATPSRWPGSTTGSRGCSASLAVTGRPSYRRGRPIDVLVDSGASIVALSYDDARRAGVYVRDSDYTQRVSTANGLARVAPVMLDRDQHRRHHRAQHTCGGERAGQPRNLAARHVVPGPPAARRDALAARWCCRSNTRAAGLKMRSVHLSHGPGPAYRRYPFLVFSVSTSCRGSDRMFPKPRADLEAEHGRFRAPAARQADRLSRIRRALAVPPGHQPDGPQRHRPGARHAGRQARRAQALRRRPRLPLLFGAR